MRFPLVLGLALAISGPAPSPAATPIDELARVTLGGVPQAVRIRGRDPARPVLLVLHGGPGFAMLPLFHAFLPRLEEHFVVVDWDQRGAGLSYSPDIPEESLTLEQFLEDLHTLTQRLKSRFSREKIYLLGHSWGSLLGLSAARAHPEDYHAFIGVGQVIHIARNETAMYDWTLERARQAGKSRAIRELEAIGRPDGDGYPGDGVEGEDPYETAARWMAWFGGDLHGERSSDEIEEWLLDHPAYRASSGRAWRAGFEFSQGLFDDPAIHEVDFMRTARTMPIPVYFLQGRHDQDTPSRLVAEYFEVLDAPRKRLVWFERSAHFPFYEESRAFEDALIALLREE